MKFYQAEIDFLFSYETKIVTTTKGEIIKRIKEHISEDEEICRITFDVMDVEVSKDNVCNMLTGGCYASDITLLFYGSPEEFLETFK
jgi:uncharacterized FAD-dependent dehydrogenase